MFKFNVVIKKILALSALLILFGCSPSSQLLNPDAGDLLKKAPESFRVHFKTTQGNILIEVKRDYSPLAVDRFYYLAKNGYYNGNKFFRVVPNFVVQWGINGDPDVNEVWKDFGIEDEEVKLSNTRGTVAFARGGVNTRSNQLYINLKDNARLDSYMMMDVKGFPAFGKVIEGMEAVDQINSEYREQPDQDSIQANGNNYLSRNFPRLDYIIETEIIE